jgi:hypothetical protein
MVYVNPLPVDAGADTMICEGTPFVLNGNTIFGANYLWSPATAVDTNTTASTDFIANQNTTLLYNITRAGCSSTDTLEIVVQVAPQASYTANYSLLSLDVDFINTAMDYDSLVWNFGDGFTDTVINPTHTYAQNGFYNACLYVYNACGIDSVCQDVDLTIVGLHALKNKIVSIRTSDGFIVSQNKVINSYTLYDITGKQLRNEISQSNKVEIEFSGMPKGCYLIELNSGDDKKVLKLMW